MFSGAEASHPDYTGQSLFPGKESLSRASLSLLVVSSKLGGVTGTAIGAEGTAAHYHAAGGIVILFPEPIGISVNALIMLTAFPDPEGESTIDHLPPGR